MPSLVPLAAVPLVDPKRHGISLVSLQPPARSQRAIELMAVDHQHSAALDGAMDQLSSARRQAEQVLNYVGVELVVITWQQLDAHATAAPRHDFFDHSALRRSP